MKSRIQYILQRILGLDTYLFLFSWFKIKTLKSDRYERDFFKFLDLIEPGSTVLDIGANIGIMSYHLCQIDDAEVLAFEPIPRNVNTLERIKNFFRLENLDIYPIALGNTTGHIDMVMPVVQNVKKQGLSHVLTEEIKEFNEGDTFKVDITRLDDIDKVRDQKISAIKMDVENYEYQVLLGAVEMLENDHPIIYCELWDNENRAKCFELLRDIGYNVCVLDWGSLKKYDGSQPTQNFFFLFD